MSPRVGTTGSNHGVVATGFYGVASIISIVARCWSNVETINAVVAPTAFGIVEYYYFCSGRGHRGLIVVEDAMYLRVG